jgi:hypothetical protein
MASMALLSWMQDIAQLWGDLLHVSGRALEITKCNYYVMEWQFSRSGITELDKKVQTNLHIASGDGIHVMLTNNSVEEAHKMLGKWKPALRTQKKQFEVLLKKSNEYACTNLSSAVSQREKRAAYSAVFLP